VMDSFEHWFLGPLEHCQVKWTRFNVGNAFETKTRADST
jgi:hypothetical protein